MAGTVDRQTYRLGEHRGVWCAVIGHGRNKQRHSLGLATPKGARKNGRAGKRLKVASKDEALRELRSFNTAVSTASIQGTATVAEIFDAYVKDREAEGKASAVRRAKEAWRQMGTQFGHLRPDQFDRQTWRDYIARRRGLGVSNGGIRSELVYLSAALGFGKATKLYACDKPEVILPPAGRPRDRWLTKAEAMRLIEAARRFHLKVWLHLALATAGRPSHILQLTWDRVDMQAWTVQLDDPEREATKKGRAFVPIEDPDVREALKLARDQATTKWVVEYNGAPVKNVIMGVKAAAKRAKLKGVTPYVLRHTACVLMAQRGVPMVKIMEFAGHTNLGTTTKHYARHHPDFLRDAAAALTLREGPKQIEDKRAREDNEDEK
jgi:integrase